VIERLIRSAVLTVFKARCPMDQLKDAVVAFEDRAVVHAGDDVASSSYVESLSRLPGLRSAVLHLAQGESPGAVASATEFVLEGLHLSKRLNKDSAGGRATYRGR
jgi:magnesium chelatase subunit I